MTSSTVYDVCVVGAGVMGSATARYLARLGHQVLLLEQFPIPHWRGSSHGQSRIFRSTYSNPVFVKMAEDSKAMWKDIELQANEEILISDAGFLTVEDPPCATIQSYDKLLVDLDVEHELLSPLQLKERFPDLQFGEGYSAVLEKTAGVLKADKCLRCLQDQFRHFGGVLRDGQKVLSIQQGSRSVTVKTSQSVYTANKLVLTAGPWTNQLLKPLGIQIPIKIYRAPVLYWNITKPGAYSRDNGFPSFYDCSSSDGRHMYAVSNTEYPDMIKLGPAGEAQASLDYMLTADPDRRDSNRQDVERFIQSASGYLKEHFPYIDHRQPAIVEMCMYSMTPDLAFILDKHPSFDNVIIGAGFSAHGFKHAPVVGQILGDLAVGRTPAYDISQFTLSRFAQSKAKL